MSSLNYLRSIFITYGIEVTEMKTLYHIVPKNDGYTYLCRSNDKLFLANKEAPIHSGKLVFESYVKAEKFIEENNLEGYKVEAFLWR